MNIAFAGGGTGGHVFPIKSIIDYIKKDNKITSEFENIYWFGEKNSLEEKIANDISNVKFIKMISGKLRRDKSIISFAKNIIDLFKFGYGITKSIFLLKKYKIDVVFCKGGYVALPVVIASKILRKKVFVHESDTVAGLTNRIANKFSNKSYTGFPKSLKGGQHIGQILSENILNFNNLDKFDTSLTGELDSNFNKKTNILIVGGSQGSKNNLGKYYYHNRKK
ncbi:glycosyltransferase [Candidatus Vampirococcus lugosii]|uniref:N-acetylglucosaminyltransferase (MurG) n=1 Tax=Candidatus Vampirococcus lugosii TaxID=2789015 RepID=A0ABS5QLG6_9BACT|nr:glycosyltransferase [Candidatus Vampirococcus lugosii]MBS8122041.1 N-acetylglucosaminyltransferase (MurG) [Candidatus Vampirococcus lugosii]